LGGSTGSVGIFVSYRRDDVAGYAGRLHEALTERFGPGRVFIDLHSIEPGTDFVTATEQALAQCRVVLALIGPRWLTVRTESGARRLEESDDYVRRELEIAFAGDLVVIPVLLRGAMMPHESQLPASLARLWRCQAFELSDRRWHETVAELADSLNRVLEAASSDADENVGVPLTGIDVPFPPALTFDDVFVGREDALTQLNEAWQRAKLGQHQTALVTGEPGIGKTRLVAEFASRVNADGGIVLYGRCDDELGVAYQPFVEALRQVVLATGADLGHVVGRTDLAELHRIVRELTEVFPDLPAPVRADPERERYELFEAVRRFFVAVSRLKPVVLVLDDAHWGAKPTVLLVRHLVGATDVGATMVIGTYRHTELTARSALTDLIGELRRGGVREVAVSSLTIDEVSVYVSGVGAREHREAGFAQELWAGTEGVPLFVREMLAHLREAGDVAGAEPTVPLGVRDLIDRRVARLSRSARDLLAAAAVAGATVALALLERVSAYPRGEFLDAIDEVFVSGIVIDVGGEVGEVTFSHALVRDAIYVSLTTARRAHLHEEVARALESFGEVGLDDDRVPALAHHWSQAARLGHAATAAEYARRAGEQALRRLAFEEAVQHLQRGLHVLDHAPTADARQRIALLMCLGEARLATREPDAARDAARRAADEARRVGDRELLARAAVLHASRYTFGKLDSTLALLTEALAAVGESSPITRIHVLAELSQVQILQGDHPQGEQHAKAALEAARDIGDPYALSHAVMARVVSLWGTPHAEERLALTEELLELSAAVGDANGHFSGLLFRSYTLAELGDLSGHDRVYIEQLHANRRIDLDNPHVYWRYTAYSHLDRPVWIAWNRVFVAMLHGDWKQADELATRGLSHAGNEPTLLSIFAGQLFHRRREQGRAAELLSTIDQAVSDNPAAPVYRAALALALLDAGRINESFTHAQSLWAHECASIPTDLTRTATLAMLIEVCAAICDRSPADTLHRVLSPHSGHLVIVANEVACMGAVDRYLAMLETVLERWNDAEQHFESALALERRIESPPLIARTQYWYGSMLGQRDSPTYRERANQLLTQCAHTASNLGMALLAEQATAKLDTTS